MDADTKSKTASQIISIAADWGEEPYEVTEKVLRFEFGIEDEAATFCADVGSQSFMKEGAAGFWLVEVTL